MRAPHPPRVCGSNAGAVPDVPGGMVLRPAGAQWNLGHVGAPEVVVERAVKGKMWAAWPSTWSWTRPSSLSSLLGPCAPLQEPVSQPAHPREIFRQKERAMSTTSITSPQPGESFLWV